MTYIYVVRRQRVNVVVSQNKPHCLRSIIDRGSFADGYFVGICCSGYLLKVKLAVS
jgi:hypothetical protein